MEPVTKYTLPIERKMIMNKILSFFELKFPPKTDLPIEEQRKRWLMQFLKAFLVVFVCYMAMYLIRNNFKAAQPDMVKQYGLNKAQLGQIGFVFSLTYGVGKTLLGYFIDGKNSKRFVSFLLILSAISVITMGFFLLYAGANLGIMMVLWGISGLFQSAGGPASYSTIARWTSAKIRGRWLGWWNVSHNVGGAVAGVFAIWAATTFMNGNVAGMFLIPGFIALGIGILGLFIGHDSPEELGWEKAEVLFNEPIVKEDEVSEKMSKWEIFKKYVLFNKYIWILSIANIFVYIVRIGIDNWSSLYVSEQLHIKSAEAATTLFWFEMGAMLGSFSWGWLSDLVKGRRALVAIACMVMMFGAVYFYATATSLTAVNIALFVCGTLIFGPQLLIGISLVGFVPKKGVTVANGMTGTFGYILGDSVAKVVLGWIAEPTSGGLNLGFVNLHGWGSTFTVMYAAIVVGIILLAYVAVGEERKIRERKAAMA